MKRVVRVLSANDAKGGNEVKTAYKARNVLPKAAGPVLKDAVVVVEDERIESVGQEIPGKCKLIDLGEVTLMPGLIDSHVHLMWSGEGADPDALRRSENKSLGMVRMAKHAKQTIAAGDHHLPGHGKPNGNDSCLAEGSRLRIDPRPSGHLCGDVDHDDRGACAYHLERGRWAR